MVGYSVQNLNEISDRYKCCLCSLIIREPVQLECGHRFCQACVEHAKQKIIDCKVCGENVMQGNILRDRGFQRDMANLPIHCRHCSWSGTYKSYEVHLTECNQTCCNDGTSIESQTSSSNHSNSLQRVEFLLSNSRLLPCSDMFNDCATKDDHSKTIVDSVGCLWKISNIASFSGERNLNQHLHVMTHDGYVMRFDFDLRLNLFNRIKYFCVNIASMKGDFDSILKWPLTFQLNMGLFNVATHQTDYVKCYLLTFHLPNDRNLELKRFVLFSLASLLHKRTSYVIDDSIILKILICKEPLPKEILQAAMNIDHFKPTSCQMELILRLEDDYRKLNKLSR